MINNEKKRFNKIKTNHPNYHLYDRISGPYIRSNDNRIILIASYKNKNTKTTLSYPKFLIECINGKLLNENETIDHIDRNPLNNNINNLQILDRSEHVKLDARRLKDQNFICPYCLKNFKLSDIKLHRAKNNRLRGKSGPFCSKKCTGKYGADIQNNKIKKFKVVKIQTDLYQIDKLPSLNGL